MATKSTAGKYDPILRREISGRIKIARENCGYTQEECAEKCNMSTRSYQRLENGELPVSADKLRTLHDKVGFDPTFLITGEEFASETIEYILNNSSPHNREMALGRVLEYVKNHIF